MTGFSMLQENSNPPGGGQEFSFAGKALLLYCRYLSNAIAFS